MTALLLGGHLYVLTSKGRSVISKIAPNQWSPSGAEATLVERRRTAVEITGISDIEWDYYKGKQVDFIWHWNEDDMPDALTACFPAALSPRKGTAYFRLYDDGWRVEHLERQAEGVL